LLHKKLYLAAGVLAAFECKNTLRLAHIRRAVSTGVAIRELVRADPSVKHAPVFGLLAHTHAVTTKRKHPAESVSEALLRADQALVTDPRDCLDFVCVVTLGTWSLMRVILEIEKGEPRVTTIYMGPITDERLPLGQPPDPLGRFLTGLLRRLANSDPGLKVFGEYFAEVGLFGIGRGTPRDWAPDSFPPESLDIVF
jgi:hypothetical protein